MFVSKDACLFTWFKLLRSNPEKVYSREQVALRALFQWQDGERPSFNRAGQRTALCGTLGLLLR